MNALEWNVSVPKNRVKVAVAKGWVTLDGNVEWYYQKRAAEDAVLYLAGVPGVSNNIAVTSKPVHVEDVKGKIEAALKRSAEVDAKKIAVRASDGRVTLTGTVRSFIERQDAVSAAWSAPGVTNVVDEIRVHA